MARRAKNRDNTAANCHHCGLPISRDYFGRHRNCFPQFRNVLLAGDGSGTCSVVEGQEGPRCTRKATHSGWCSAHYQAWYRTGHPHGHVSPFGVVVTPGRVGEMPCGVCPADNQRSNMTVGQLDDGTRLCRYHYATWKRTGDPTTEVRTRAPQQPLTGPCEAQGCERPPRSRHLGRALCGAHYQRSLVHKGDIHESAPIQARVFD